VAGFWRFRELFEQLLIRPDECLKLRGGNSLPICPNVFWVIETGNLLKRLEPTIGLEPMTC
jgi:hypothetical protein